jgi:hypothetical protein|tara:strand:- start:758 stop:1207 length:450 start_codon:yes stop_codon:yes gene_type:complete
MSEREDIAAHIVTTLTAVSSPITFGKVTREPFEIDELSQQQFPAVFIQTADETREDITIKNSNITRTGTIDFRIFGFVSNASASTVNIDTKRNQLVTTVETALDSDRTRNGNALDTQLVAVETDEGSIFPYGGAIMTIRCFYKFTQGTP